MWSIARGIPLLFVAWVGQDLAQMPLLTNVQSYHYPDAGLLAGRAEAWISVAQIVVLWLIWTKFKVLTKESN